MPAIPVQGMVAWFKSENAGSVWPSEVGDFAGRSTKPSVYRRVEAGFGADRPVTYLYGGSNSKFDFGLILKPTFTLCSVSRYIGGKNLRILQSRHGNNLLHGHWSGKVGVAYYNKWVTKNDIKSNTAEWLVLCGTNGAQRVYSGTANSTNIATAVGKELTKDEPLYINHGYSDEASEFGVMEVITWDRALSDEEIAASMDYLKWKLRVGAVLETSEHMSRQYESNFVSYGEQHLSGVKNQIFNVNLANGYTAELSGWTHTRAYAHGFLRNENGKAMAVVKNLTAGKKYLYELAMVGKLKNYNGEAKVSVNQGVESRVWSDTLIVPRFSGVTTASSTGEITFEFERIAKHVYLSSIAMAAVTDAPSTPPKPADPPAEVRRGDSGLRTHSSARSFKCCFT